MEAQGEKNSGVSPTLGVKLTEGTCFAGTPRGESLRSQQNTD